MSFRTFFSLIFLFTGTHLLAQDTISNIETIIKREMQERRIPGLQIAIVQNGKIVVNKSYGIANIQDNVSVTNSTIFAINSCTKVFTAVAIMQLVEDGKIDLSAPVSNYLDSLPNEWQPVTINQMLTHTSGFPDLLKILDPFIGSVGSLKNEENIWEKLKTLPMDFKPGERFSYNQTNGYLLGKIINKLYGKPFVQMFFEKQFQPLEMQNTLFGDSRDIIPHFAPTYNYRQNIDGRRLPEERLVNNYYEFPYFRRTAAGLNSTAGDMANWIIALQTGKLIKSKRLLNTMWSPIQFNDGTPTPWALGWGMNKFRTKHRAVGMSGGGRAAFLVYPDDGIAVIVLTNLSGSFPEDFLEELAGVYNPEITNADPITFLRINLRKVGFEKAIEIVEKEKKINPQFIPNEFELNEWAYRMMAKGQLKEAVEIFKLNAHLFPNSSNAYDSYAEGLLKIGDKDGAIKMYKKSLALNPDNQNGKKVLEQITQLP